MRLGLTLASLFALAVGTPAQSIPRYEWYIALSPDFQWGTCCYQQQALRGMTPLLLNLWRPMPRAWLQPGDLTQWAEPWEFAWAGNLLSHVTVPAFTCVGNHDMDAGRWPSTLNGWSSLPSPWNARSRYDTFSTPSGDVAVLSLPYFVPDQDIAWARAEMDANPMPTILLTHSWVTGATVPGTLWPQGGTLGHAGPNSPLQAHEKLVVPYPQIRMVICGHGHGENRRTDVTLLGTTVLSHLFNPQNDPFGGVEWLRLMAFHGDKADLWTFAPSGTMSSVNRTSLIQDVDLGQVLTDPVPSTTHYYGPGEVEDTWIRSIWGGSYTNPTADLLYGAHTGPSSGGEIGLMRFRDPALPATVATARKAVLTLTKEGYQSAGPIAFHKMLRPWGQNDSWNSLGGLVAGVDYEVWPAFQLAEPRQWTWNVEVAEVPEWGWAIFGTTRDRGGIRSSEHPEGPMLTVLH